MSARNSKDAAPTTLRIGARWHIFALLATAFLFAAVVIAVLSKKYSTVEADVASIVVLPFVDTSADKTDQLFCDGIALELANWLAQMPPLRVVAPRSAFAYRADPDVRTIGKALGTNHVLEGSMRRDGGHLRVTVQLIDTRDGYQMWSADFDDPVEQAIAMQNDISRAVAATLRIPLTSETDLRLAARRTASPAVYRLFLAAQYDQQLRTPEANSRAIESYRQVLKADRNFAPAYVGLSYALLNQQWFDHRSISQVETEVEPLVAEAMRLNPQSSDAYTARAALRSDQYRTDEAREDLRFAVSVNPSDSRAFAEMGSLLLRGAEPRDASWHFARASALDPLDFRLHLQRCIALQDMAQFAAAAAACQRARELEPHHAGVFDALASLDESRGEIDGALQWNSAALAILPNDFAFYRTRARLYLTLALSHRARETLEAGRVAGNHGALADAALVGVVFMEDGLQGLRAHLAATRLDDSADVDGVLAAARARLLLGEAAAVENLIARAAAASGGMPDVVDTPWAARLGESCQLDLAAAELDAGEAAAAQRRLERLLDMLNRMMNAGVERHATYELRAKTHALLGDADAAMQDLTRASELGWRAVWQAQHEPFFASLRWRGDFQALMDKVGRSNERMAENIH